MRWSDALGRHSVKKVPQPLKLEAAHYFGSLEKAIAALKKQGKRLPGWNRRKIMTALCRMHRSNGSLAYARSRREVPALVSAAEAHFGSWGKALYASGIDPICILSITSGGNGEGAILSEEFPETRNSGAHIQRGRHGQCPHCH